MRFRCPYCKEEFGSEPAPKCPGCGKVMLVPSLREPNPRVARRRKIENIWRECERRKAELQVALSPKLWRTPKFYVGVIFLLAIVGAAVFRATDSAVTRRVEPPHLVAMRHVDVLAEALGRYRFHVGVYPAPEQGLEALARRPVDAPEWDGPYINQLRADPWGTPFVYEPPSETGALPTLLSCGPDRVRGTADDIAPDPARFDPGTDWTNGWLSAEDRLPGVRVLRTLPEPRLRP
ncbi:MAG: type II secretion system protein GspG [Kiritimatiellae bacterium]|nr:type II secretion system protein GspG [Kiritimatiellia bacterium]